MTAGSVSIVDHGTGNLFSVARAVEYLGARPRFVKTPEEVYAAERVILPGVGAFGDCMQALRNLELVEPMLKAAADRPFMGICVGMQILFESSVEMGLNEGLGLIPGQVSRLPEQDAQGKRVKIPHIGWGELLLPQHTPSWEGTVLRYLAAMEPAYFVHSFAPVPTRPSDTLAEVEFADQRITVAVQRDGVSGCQFHPERSGPAGLEILRAFLEQ